MRKPKRAPRLTSIRPILKGGGHVGIKRSPRLTSIRPIRKGGGHVGSKPRTVKRHHPKKRGLVAPALGDYWILAMNDQMDTCTVAAVANSLLLAGGNVSDEGNAEELFALYEATKGAGGSSIEDVLNSVSEMGLAGYELCGFFPVGPQGPNLHMLQPGLIAGLRLPEGSHTVLTLPGGYVASWGATARLKGIVEEAWYVDWASL